jgi:hypothetical protein
VVSLCIIRGLACGQSVGASVTTHHDLPRHNPLAVQEKKSVTFRAQVFHREIHTPHRLACGKPVRTDPLRDVFPRFRNGYGCLSTGTAKPPGDARKIAADCSEPAAPDERVGYYSPVCSNTGDSVERIRAAIDQLASDAQDAKGDMDEGELTTRIAILWRMVSDLDPELARRAQGYTRQVGDGPSA